MAIPLSAAPASLQAPFAFPAEAEVLMRYDGAEAEDVTFGWYFVDPLVEVDTFAGGTTTTPSTNTSPGSASACALPTPPISFDSFCTTGSTSESALIAAWFDVAHFWWFDTPGEVLIEYEPPDTVDVEPPPSTVWCPPTSVMTAPPWCPPDEAVVDPVNGCPIGSTVWDAEEEEYTVWDDGGTCWVPE